MIELRDGAGALILSNDDWFSSPLMAEAFAATGAFDLPEGSKDAAIIRTLAPGRYTVIVSGAGGSSGIALVEVYEY